MPIQELSPPKRTRESKYNYTEKEVKQAVASLKAGNHPGDGPFKTAGQARAAASALLDTMGAEGKAFGSRVWEEGKGKFYFTLKEGRRAYRGRK